MSPNYDKGKSKEIGLDPPPLDGYDDHDDYMPAQLTFPMRRVTTQILEAVTRRRGWTTLHRYPVRMVITAVVA